MSRFVKVKFLSTVDDGSSDGYYYKDQLTRALKKWDTVVVPTRYGLSMAVVVETYKNASQVENAFGKYGSPVNLGSCKVVSEKIKSKAVEDITKLQKVDDIKKQLDIEMKKVDEVEKYRIYADISPEVKALLEQLEEMKA